MKYFMIGVGILSCTTAIYAKTTTTYEVGLTASYNPGIITNDSVLRSHANMTIHKDKTEFGFGIEADYITQSPIDRIDDNLKISGYQETRLNSQFAYKPANNLNITVFANAPLDYNEAKFGKQQKSIIYGSAIQWIDAQNFAIQAAVARTHYLEKGEDIQNGNILSSSIKFKFGVSPKAEFFMGAVHRKQNATTQKINGQTFEIDKKASGVGAVLGAEYTFDAYNKHHFNFEMQTGIGDLAGHISTGYRYVF